MCIYIRFSSAIDVRNLIVKRSLSSRVLVGFYSSVMQCLFGFHVCAWGVLVLALCGFVHLQERPKHERK